MSGGGSLKKMLRAGVMRDSQHRSTGSAFPLFSPARPTGQLMRPRNSNIAKKIMKRLRKKRASEGHVLKEGEGKEEGGGGA